jgi:uncharacterized membrane protein
MCFKCKIYERNKHACPYRSVALDAVVLERSCHAKEASAVLFPALFAVHIRCNNMYLGVLTKAAAVAFCLEQLDHCNCTV